MQARRAICTVLLAILLPIINLATPAQAGPPPPGPSHATLLEQLKRQTQGALRIAYHAETGKVRFMGTSLDHPMAQPAALAAGASAEQAARGFLATYGQLFGLQDQAQELQVVREKAARGGRSFVRFQQMYQGIPVLGAELVVQVDAQGNVVSANGELLPGPQLDILPQIDAATARSRALSRVAKDHRLSPDDLAATPPELWVFNPLLLGGPGPHRTTLVWRMEVTALELLPIRELVLVDARQGFVALHFNQVDTARNRRTYDSQNTSALPGVLRRSEGQPPYGDSDVDKAHDYAGHVYDFYFTTHARDSLDNAGMTLVSSVHFYDPTFCPNAAWTGSQMIYCNGFPQADDVVGHELTHGVTDFESHLFYYMQSGAINEAFSDIWGEFVDLTNGMGNDSSGVRWEMGEDVPGWGAIRDMSDPPVYGQPDRVGNSSYYYCGAGDNGGVHINSGIANKAAYLMVDGGSFNGYTVTGMGISKVAKIWYEVQTHMFTSASDYQDLYDDLYQACTNLVGSSGITPGDCQQVRNATLATEMDQQPASCPATHAPLCDIGSPVDLFFDDMENPGSGRWASAAISGVNEWYYPQTANPYGFDATYATSGNYNLWGYDRGAPSDYYMRMTSDVTLSPGSAFYLHFNHAYAFEDTTTMYDGGVLEYSTNSGGAWNDAGALFTHNGYDGTLAAGNPLGTRQAFGRNSNGYLSSRVNLSSLAGQKVRFRFRIGTDFSVNDYGWFIDDVRIYTCDASGWLKTYLPLINKNQTQ